MVLLNKLVPLMLVFVDSVVVSLLNKGKHLYILFHFSRCPALSGHFLLLKFNCLFYSNIRFFISLKLFVAHDLKTSASL